MLLLPDSLGCCKRNRKRRGIELRNRSGLGYPDSNLNLLVLTLLERRIQIRKVVQKQSKSGQNSVAASLATQESMGKYLPVDSGRRHHHNQLSSCFNYIHVNDFTDRFGFWKELSWSRIFPWTEEVQIPHLLQVLSDKSWFWWMPLLLAVYRLCLIVKEKLKDELAQLWNTSSRRVKAVMSGFLGGLYEARSIWVFFSLFSS